MTQESRKAGKEGRNMAQESRKAVKEGRNMTRESRRMETGKPEQDRRGERE